MKVAFASCARIQDLALQPACDDIRECQPDVLLLLGDTVYLDKSTVVTTNRAFADWGEVFPNAACVVSLIDRLMHRAEVVRINGESYRAKEAQEREAQRLAARSAKATPARVRKAGA